MLELMKGSVVPEQPQGQWGAWGGGGMEGEGRAATAAAGEEIIKRVQL